MKKLTKLLLTVSVICALLSAMSFSVYAIPMPEYSVLSFKISGTETYSDGSALAEDECYALVWSGDGEFDGINPNGTPIGEGDEVVYIGKIHKDTDVFFQIKEGFKSGGVFGIYILDTRVFDDNDELQKVGKTEGIVNVRNYVKAANAKVTVSGSQAIPTAVDGLPNGAVIAPPTVDPTNIPALKLTSIEVDGDYVVMLADNTIPSLSYATVASGKESGVITSTDNKIVLIRPKTGDSAIISGLSRTVFSTGDLRIIITIAAVFTASVLVLAVKRKKRVSFSDSDTKK